MTNLGQRSGGPGAEARPLPDVTPKHNTATLDLHNDTELLRKTILARHGHSPNRDKEWRKLRSIVCMALCMHISNTACPA
jgi:hypothetical protein